MRFDEIPFTCLCEKEDKKALGFQISHFYGSFSNDIMAVKGLIARLIALSLLVTLVDQLYRKVALCPRRRGSAFVSIKALRI